VGLLSQLKDVVLSHNKVSDASATRREATKGQCHRMVDVKRANVSSPEKAVKLKLIGDPADDPETSQVIQIDAFDAV
jgi:hypothetical protein